jgi:sec-independent protein translocase protein TatC
VVLFYCGVSFAHFLVFPLVFEFMAGVTPAGVTMMTDISRYLDFILKMFFAFGFAFEIPVATLLLAWSGLTTAAGMAAKRPYVIVGCFVVGMLLTPPDVISQLMLALPTWVLFELGVFFARFAERRNVEPG